VMGTRFSHIWKTLIESLSVVSQSRLLEFSQLCSVIAPAPSNYPKETQPQ
jgi:hypothetical protein